MRRFEEQMIDLSPGQMDALEWMSTHRHGLLPLHVGFGKTRIGLAKIMEIGLPTLVVSTKHIIEKTWPDEIKKIGLSLSYAACCGPKRKRDKAIDADPDVLGVSFENLVWYYQSDAKPRRVLIIDESSKLKAPGAQRSRTQVRHAGEYDYAYALSATPAPEGAMGLWSQFACLTRDRPLGLLTEFRARYFDQAFAHTGQTHIVYTIKDDGLQGIAEAVKDYFYSMPKEFDAEVGLPDPYEFGIEVPWSTETGLKQYQDMSRNFCIESNEDYEVAHDVSAGSPGVLQNKLRQMASGFLYTDDRTVVELEGYDDKIAELGYFLDRIDDQPLLVFTQFQEEARQIAEAYPAFQIGLPDSLDDWNQGRVPGMVLHPGSAGHGLNLQEGSHHILFYSLPWSSEAYDQAIGRLNRRGQPRRVMVAHLAREGTIEARMFGSLLTKREKQKETINVLGEAAKL